MSKLKEMREKSGLSQRKLADAAGVNFRMLQYYEQGANDINEAAAKTVYRLAQALDCRMEDIIEVDRLSDAL